MDQNIILLVGFGIFMWILYYLQNQGHFLQVLDWRPVEIEDLATGQAARCHGDPVRVGSLLKFHTINPDEVYKWFMELFIDAYDWVMVPNVYGMSQYADGGLITTKPYISSSNYIRKMSDFLKGTWCEIWDGLYWRFINKHRDFFQKNPRMSVMTRQLERMGKDKLNRHLVIADEFLEKFWKS